MSTTATKVQTKWDAKKIQDATAHMFASMFVASFETISKVSPKALEEWQTIMRNHKIEHYKKIGVKTPMELAKAIAETDHNLFGSELEISGDDNKATIKYNKCAMWEATQKIAKFNEAQQKQMGESCQGSWAIIAKEFGFKVEPKMTEDTYEMTFSK
jgi:hypothetical protein